MLTFRYLRSLEEKLTKYRSGEVDFLTRIFWNLSYETIVKKAIDVSSKGDVVLDVGCGTGGYLIALLKEGRRCYGIDPLRDVSLLKARKRAVKEKGDIFLFQSVGEFLPFKSGFFDVVLCISTLQHVSNQRMTLHEVRRVLKNEGLLLISVPTIKNIGTFFREAEIPSYFTMGFDINGFRKILLDSDFRILDMKGCGFFPPFVRRFLTSSYYLFGETLTRRMMEAFNVFANVWLLTASSVIALCEKED